MKVFNWNAQKNQALIEGRGVSFEKVVIHIQSGRLLDDIIHPNATTYPNQRIFLVAIEEYVYLVPYVEDADQIFLKTIIPSRKFTKRYLGGVK
jgi:uncharacterized DUF497 family protein